MLNTKYTHFPKHKAFRPVANEHDAAKQDSAMLAVAGGIATGRGESDTLSKEAVYRRMEQKQRININKFNDNHKSQHKLMNFYQNQMGGVYNAKQISKMYGIYQDGETKMYETIRPMHMKKGDVISNNLIGEIGVLQDAQQRGPDTILIFQDRTIKCESASHGWSKKNLITTDESAPVAASSAAGPALFKEQVEGPQKDFVNNTMQKIIKEVDSQDDPHKLKNECEGMMKGMSAEKEHIDTAKKLFDHEITPSEAPFEIAKTHIEENKDYYSKFNPKSKGKEFLIKQDDSEDDEDDEDDDTEEEFADESFDQERQSLSGFSIPKTPRPTKKQIAAPSSGATLVNTSTTATSGVIPKQTPPSNYINPLKKPETISEHNINYVTNLHGTRNLKIKNDKQITQKVIPNWKALNKTHKKEIQNIPSGDYLHIKTGEHNLFGKVQTHKEGFQYITGKVDIHESKLEHGMNLLKSENVKKFSSKNKKHEYTHVSPLNVPKKTETIQPIEKNFDRNVHWGNIQKKYETEIEVEKTKEKPDMEKIQIRENKIQDFKKYFTMKKSEGYTERVTQTSVTGTPNTLRTHVSNLNNEEKARKELMGKGYNRTVRPFSNTTPEKTTAWSRGIKLPQTSRTNKIENAFTTSGTKSESISPQGSGDKKEHAMDVDTDFATLTKANANVKLFYKKGEKMSHEDEGSIHDYPHLIMRNLEKHGLPYDVKETTNLSKVNKPVASKETETYKGILNKWKEPQKKINEEKAINMQRVNFSHGGKELRKSGTLSGVRSISDRQPGVGSELHQKMGNKSLGGSSLFGGDIQEREDEANKFKGNISAGQLVKGISGVAARHRKMEQFNPETGRTKQVIPTTPSIYSNITKDKDLEKKKKEKKQNKTIEGVGKTTEMGLTPADITK